MTWVLFKTYEEDDGDGNPSFDYHVIGPGGHYKAHVEDTGYFEFYLLRQQDFSFCGDGFKFTSPNEDGSVYMGEFKTFPEVMEAVKSWSLAKPRI
jgi:hypothetical protein